MPATISTISIILNNEQRRSTRFFFTNIASWVSNIGLFIPYWNIFGKGEEAQTYACDWIQWLDDDVGKHVDKYLLPESVPAPLTRETLEAWKIRDPRFYF